MSWGRLIPKPKALALAVLAGACLLLPPSAGPARAQFDPFGWFGQFFKPSPPPGRVARPRNEMYPEPRWGRPRPGYRHRADREPAERWPERPKAKPAAKPAAAPTYFVAVLGDSLAQMLAKGLSEAFETRPEVAILRKAKEDSGLVRDDFFDWVKSTKELLESGQKIDFAVMMIGSNDRQALRDANGSYEVRSPEWLAAYTQRIETIAAMFRDKKIPLVWVGLPIMKSETLAADVLALNELYRAYAEKAGAKYIDTWEAFADEGGHYSPVGPDINGQIVRLRAADGVHFTKAGARKLAHFVEPEIRRNLDEVQPQGQPGAGPEAVPETANAPAGNPAASPASSEIATFPLPKAPAGPILPLTSVPLAAKGELATQAGTAGALSNDAGILIEQALQQGKPLAPKPGRADDFSWPRNE